MMKLASELRVGNVIMNGKEPMVVLRAEYNKSGGPQRRCRTSFKLKNLLNNSGTETVCKADEKYDVLMLDKREAHLFVLCRPAVCVHGQTNTTSSRSRPRSMGDVVQYLDDGMPDWVKSPSTKAAPSRSRCPTAWCVRSNTPNPRSRATPPARS